MATDSSGVLLAGFHTTVFPEARAGAIFHAGMRIGKFHGVMTPDHAQWGSHGTDGLARIVARKNPFG